MTGKSLLLKGIAYSLAFATSLTLLEMLFRLIDAQPADRWIARGAVIASVVLGGAGQRLIDRNRSSVRSQ